MFRGINRLHGNGHRLFSTSNPLKSYIGSSPIIYPEGVNVQVRQHFEPKRIFKGRYSINLSKEVIITGPKGKLKVDVADFVSIEDVKPKITVSVKDSQQGHQRALWGTYRSLINNHVIGVSEGHLCIVKLVGTGYRAQIEEKDGKKVVGIKAGTPNVDYFDIPAGIEVSSPVPTRLIIEGADKQQVKLFAGIIRQYHPPEPYKGKGIYVDDESIKLKDKKVK